MPSATGARAPVPGTRVAPAVPALGAPVPPGTAQPQVAEEQRGRGQCPLQPSVSARPRGGARRRGARVRVGRVSACGAGRCGAHAHVCVQRGVARGAHCVRTTASRLFVCHAPLGCGHSPPPVASNRGGRCSGLRVHRLEAPPSAPPAGGGKATWQPRAWGLGSGPCPRFPGTLSCLASLPSTQIIGADGSSSASYLRRTLAKCIPGSWDGSPPREPSSGKFFRKLDSGCVGLPPSLFFRKAPARPWEAQFPGSPAVPPGLDLGENVGGNRRGTGAGPSLGSIAH